MTLRDVIVAFIAFREEVITRRTDLSARTRRASGRISWSASLVAVANIDEVIALIRAAPDPAARARAADRRGAGRPATSAPLIALIGETGRARRRRRHLPALRRAGARHPRSAAAAPDRPRARQDRRGAAGAGRRDRRAISRSCARATGCSRCCASELLAIKEQFANPRRTDDRGCRVRGRYRGPDPARGHGRHGQPCRLHQARAAVDLSRAAPRRHAAAPAWRSRDEDFVSRGVRRLDPHAGAVLHLAGPGLQAQGLPPAARHAAGARPADGQPAAARRGRDDLDRHAAARGRGELGAI